jgi:glycosyltransferase involved in cell wall biosynthesis
MLVDDQAPITSMTVVICAYTEDRWDTLRRGADLVAKQLAFGDELLVIVDHNEALLARCRESLEWCRAIPNQHARGLSGARNTAIQEALGSVIAFLDDDAAPLDGWLDTLRRPYCDDRVCGTGGSALARWPGQRPKWFPDEFLWVVGCSYRGMPVEAGPIRNVFGANMSFRRTAFDNVGGFIEEMGRVGETPVGCEETEFSIRLTASNPDLVIMYQPTSQVEHFIADKRTSLRYFVRRCWAEGLSKAQVSRRVGRSSALSAEHDYVRRVLPSGVLRGLREAILGDGWGAARSAVIVLGLAVTTAGYCHGSLRSASHAASKD